MKTLVSALALSLVLVAGSVHAQSARDPAAEARIHADVAFLADDALEGRGTGQRGYDLAAQYVQTRMQGMGLQPGAAGSWRQPVTIARMGIAAEGATLAWKPAGGQPVVWTSGVDALFGMGREAGHALTTGQLVFVGFGADGDYAGLNTAGKIVVFLSGAPAGASEDEARVLEASKARIAEAHGAIGTITVNTTASAARFNDTLLRRYANRTETVWVGPDGPKRSAPGIRATAFLNDAAAAALFAGGPKSYADIRAEAASGRPAGFALEGEAVFDVNTRREDVQTSNVIGLIEGTDPVLKNEYVILTAHLDHLGVSGTGEDRINNGALDNAGGIATMLEAARSLAADPPRRSVLVVALTAEELGLVGSDYLARYPVVPNVVADVNLDMPILTYAFTDVVAFGAEHSTLGPLVAAAARTEGVTLSPDPMPEQNIFTRSDHYSFVQAGVPSVMLATGYANGGEAAWGTFFANGYHKPADDLSGPLDWTAAARFARVNAAIARGIADADQRPLWYAGNPYGDRYAPGAERAPAPR
ncbi:MAG: M28 family peptidase [Brevundimonas sp.]